MRCLTPVDALNKQHLFPYPLSGVYIRRYKATDAGDESELKDPEKVFNVI